MKKLELKDKIIEIKTCRDCPFRIYDSNYSMSTDSGYDCIFLGRLADDNQLSKYNQKIEEINKVNATLFKYEGEIPNDPLEIPFDCPLKDMEFL